MGQVSPGRLSKAHASMDGSFGCLKCHVFGAGKPVLKCVGCHQEIASRLKLGMGYHARVMKGRRVETGCAGCHTEHYGRDFNIMPWPASREEFDHRLTGFPLEGKHARVECAECHAAKRITIEARKQIRIKNLNRTHLGLSQACASCHRDVHAGQLEQDCLRCHSQLAWKPAPGFRHEQTAYPLTGMHVRVSCEKCHRAGELPGGAMRYKMANAASCATCHRDPHGGAFEQPCSACHQSLGWKNVPKLVSTFNHDRTRFALKGSHRDLSCRKCHRTADFHSPVAHSRCLDCHREEHGPQFRLRADGSDCASCHAEQRFKPSTFVLAFHQQAAYPLEGRHAQVRCAQCHTPRGAATDYHPVHQRCMDCHRDEHTGQFAQAPWLNRCEQYHNQLGFRPSLYNVAQHREARFPLTGGHLAVPCGQCHKSPDVTSRSAAAFRLPRQECTSCHSDPHGIPVESKANLSAGCLTCHTLNNWNNTIHFDHSATAFPLDGAHRSAGCLDCHRAHGLGSGMWRMVFAGSPKACSSCHADPHGGQFRDAVAAGDCNSCHPTNSWLAAKFDHDRQADFSLSGSHREVPCRMCHSRTEQIGGALVRVYKGTPANCEACHN